jgi:hypothetical protein
MKTDPLQSSLKSGPGRAEKKRRSSRPISSKCIQNMVKDRVGKKPF